MNVDKFFEKYSIEEISQKTKISPISLKLIKNKEYEKIPKAKFMGFISIIEKEFKIDLSELREEYNNLNIENTKETEESPPIKEKNSSNKLYLLLAFILLILGGYLLLKQSPKPTKKLHQEIKIPSTNKVIFLENNESNESNNTQTKINITSENNITTTNNEINSSMLNTSKSLHKKQTPNKKINFYQIAKEGKLVIIPHKKVWYRALNIDTNKTYEYLTSNTKILPKGNYYIKLGHGEVTILYNDLNITPNTKKIVRILIKNNKYKFMPRYNIYERKPLKKVKKNITKNESNISQEINNTKRLNQ